MSKRGDKGGKAAAKERGSDSDSAGAEDTAATATAQRTGGRRRRRRKRIAASADVAAQYKVAKSDLTRLAVLFTRYKNSQVGISYKQFKLLMHAATRCFKAEPTLIEITGPVTIFGNLYGQYPCLWKLLSIAGFPPSEGHTYVFIGNFGSRGNMGVETIALLLMLKVRWPNYVYLLRGNHECAKMAEVFGLKEALRSFTFVYEGKDATSGELVEMVARKPRFRGSYDDARSQLFKLWQWLTRMFDHMPLAASIGQGKVLCLNGGLSPEVVNEQGLDRIKSLRRPIDVPPSGLVTDLLWACPVEDPDGFNPSMDGVTMCFGPDVIDKFCTATGVQLIVRSLQIPANGHVFNPCDNCLTLFSAVELLEEHKHQNIASILYLDAALRGTVRRYSVEPAKEERTTMLASVMTRIMSKAGEQQQAPAAVQQDERQYDAEAANIETERPDNIDAFGREQVAIERVAADATIMQPAAVGAQAQAQYAQVLSAHSGTQTQRDDADGDKAKDPFG